ncbi:unnamed protein product [Choristocarpus tenellus]
MLHARALRLERMGKVTAGAIEEKAKMVYKELQDNLDAHIAKEAAAVEGVMSLALDHIARQSPIEFEWRIQGEVLEVDKYTRLLPHPESHPEPQPRPTVAEVSHPSLAQETQLRAILHSVSHVSADGAAAVMPETVVDVLLRMQEGQEGQDDLPDHWATLSREDLAKISLCLLDPDDHGEVHLEEVVQIIISTSPAELLAALEGPYQGPSPGQG